MKMIRAMIVALCLTAPIAHADTPPTTQIASVVVHTDTLTRISEAGFYGAVGTATALGGVVLTVLGLKGIAEKESKSGAAFLIAAGIALFLAGINIATGK